MKLIVFDIDGTLTDTKEVEGRCFVKAFEKTFQISLKHQNWNVFKNVTDWGITEEIILEHYNRLATSEEYEEMISNFMIELKMEYEIDHLQFKEIPGAKSFFQHIQSISSYQLGIATGAWAKSALFKLNAIGLNTEGIAFSNSNYHQEREEITKAAIMQARTSYGKEFDEIIYFGDGAWDYQTCKNLGIRFIGIDVLGDGKLKELGAKTIFRNFVNQEEILKELNV